jgi:hypothetical protein
MRKSSINIADLNTTSYEHNHRNYDPGYLIETNKENEFLTCLADDYYVDVENKYGTYKKPDFNRIDKELRENFKNTFGQRSQDKTKFFKEALINTDQHITKEHFYKLAETLKEKFKISVIDIAHHRDEGYIEDDGEVNINYHAHLIFINADVDTGKICRWDKTKLRELQTVVAECLEMERGQDVRVSKNKRLEHGAYKQHIKQVEKLESEIDKLKNELNELNYNNKSLKKMLELKKNELSDEKQKTKMVSDRFNNASDTVKQLTNKNTEFEALFKALGLDKIVKTTSDIKQIKKMLLEQLKSDYDKSREQLKNAGTATKNDYVELKNDNDEKKETIKKSFFNKDVINEIKKKAENKQVINNNTNSNAELNKNVEVKQANNKQVVNKKNKYDDLDI